MSLQRISPYAHLHSSWRTNGTLWIVNAAVMGLACGACACSVARWSEQGGIGLLNVANVPLALRVVMTVLALDLVSYGWHRANHTLPLLWRFHRVHHSDPTFTASTALRFHPGELLLSLPLRLAAVTVLGAPVLGVAIFELLFTVANLIEHGNIRLPLALERRWALVCVTPALHRQHHSRELAELNSNYGTVFTCWDRLLATYRPSASNRFVRTGLAGMDEPMTVTSALALPFRRG
jgi:sterol desaturase/sphingolipid hydroxylase (fatty acid hydroxylase superfamily)